MKKILIVMLTSFIVSSCTTVSGPITKKKYYSQEDPQYLQEKLLFDRQDYIKQHPGLDPKIKKIILEGKIVIGMSQEELRASWGEPFAIYRTVTNNIVNEQWMYKNIDLLHLETHSYYLTFKNGRLSNWQD
jgi:hypothetical protein